MRQSFLVGEVRSEAEVRPFADMKMETNTLWNCGIYDYTILQAILYVYTNIVGWAKHWIRDDERCV